MSRRIKSLGNQFDQVSATLAQVSVAVEAIQANAGKVIQALEDQVVDFQSRAAVLGLNSPAMRDILCRNVGAAERAWCPEFLGLVGSGPWDESELAQFLRSKSLQAFDSSGPAVNALVVGAMDWTEDELTRHLEGPDASALTIYTQELLVLGLILGEDPYSLLEDSDIAQIADSHTAIGFILESGVVWPKWPNGPVQDADWHFFNDMSVLRAHGYSVKLGGLARDERHAVLREVFESREPRGLHTVEQAAHWGPPRSGKRLDRIRKHLEWMIGFQGRYKLRARGEWIADRIWLKENLYDSSMSLDWPEVDFAASEAARGKKRTANAAFMNAMTPSPALAAVVGAEPKARTDVVSALWGYIKAHGLQDASNKRMINADAKLERVFGKKQVTMFEMAGLIGKHLK
jgi:upstream activation factor subunit UAF30